MKLSFAVALLALCFALAAARGGRGDRDDRDDRDDDDAFVVRSLAFPASFNTVVYYPACEAEDKDLDECDDELSSRATFSAVILNQGGSVDSTYYSQLATKIARQGYIVAVPNAPRVAAGPSVFQLTNTNITLATKLLLQTQSADPTSPLAGRLTPDSFAIIGHSFGGVVAIVTAASNGPALCANPANGLTLLCGGFTGFGAGLKAVLTYGTALVQRTRFGVQTINVTSVLNPVILVRGKNDGVVARADVVTAYNQLVGTKAFIELDTANHFGITDLQLVPNATVDNAVQTSTQDFSTNKLAKIFVLGLEAHLGNPRNNKAFRLIYQRKDLKILQTNVTESVVA